MKQIIEHLIQDAILKLQQNGEVPETSILVQVETTKDKQHGDFASNIALTLAKTAGKKPRELAARILEVISPSSEVEKIEIAGPGFINFFLAKAALTQVVEKILNEKRDFGRCQIGRNKPVIIEFVSTNPTGPLHVGHGRHAAFGAAIANLLDAVGFKIHREYYVNDAGRQMDIVAVSIWIRYLVICGDDLPFPSNAYQGEYIHTIAEAFHKEHQRTFCFDVEHVLKDLPPDEPQGGDKEIYIDQLIARTKALLGTRYETLFDFGLNHILADIRNDLTEFGVEFDEWFSERDFVNTGAIDKLLEKFKENGYVYTKEDALWFRSTDFGDEKDRVLVRSNGQRTYFANDVGYHLNKFARGFDLAIDLFGSDHHGYLPRMRASIEASGINPERLIPLLVQFVTLYRGKEQVQMSTRGGNFVTLRELRHEVGNDAARYFYIMRKCEQHMDFDLELAKSQSNENPVYYVQYAHARICSVLKQLQDRNLQYDQELGLAHLDLLSSEYEHQLLNTISRYPDIIISAAIHYEPHQLVNYLRDLASDFHAYYNAEQFLVDNETLRNARLSLISATKQILVNSFELIGISAPESM